MLRCSIRRFQRYCVSVSGHSVREPAFVRTISTGRRALNEDLKVYMHGRGNRERNDSVTNEILYERHRHLERLNRLPAENDIVRALTASGLGDRKRKHQVYASVSNMMHGGGSYNNTGYKKTNSGAGGFAQHLSSASQNWPIFKHLLPEIAFAGHSNSGKSTLVNAMIGVLPSKGPAKVSERAGWTDQICFYQLGKKPPVLTLADLPGYGHAVASDAQRRAWGNMMRDYLQNRPVLSRCCILVDATRGLCKGDKMLVRFLTKYSIPWLIVLTKGDLLDCPTLARCVLAVQLDLAQYITADTAKYLGTAPEESANRQAASSGNDSRNGAAAESDAEQSDAEGDVSSTGTVCDESEFDANDYSSGEDLGEEGHREEGDLALSMDHAEIDEEYFDREADQAGIDAADAQIGAQLDAHVDENSTGARDDEHDENHGSEEGAESGEESDQAEDEGEQEEGESFVAEDHDLPNRRLVPVVVVSSSTGAGVQQLWKRLCSIAKDDSVLPQGVAPGTSHVVREHRMAAALRRRHAVQHSIDRRSSGNNSRPREQSREPLRPTLRPVKLTRNRRSVRARIREAAEDELAAAKKRMQS